MHSQKENAYHPMLLSICSCYAADNGNAGKHLERIANAGFDGVAWIHHWSGDFMYTPPEIRQIRRWLNDYDLKLFDLHGSDGREKKWYSETEYERQAGVVLVKNRVEMTQELGGKVVVMHVPRFIPENGNKWTQLRKSLDELEGFCAQHHVRIAIENLFYDDFNGISELMRDYSPKYLGLCYDSGHGNMGGLGLARIVKYPDRLFALHLHDNNGYDDQHKPLFSGTVDWQSVAAAIAASSYKGPLTLETEMRNSGFTDEDAFLRKAHINAKKLVSMIEKEQKRKSR